MTRSLASLVSIVVLLLAFATHHAVADAGRERAAIADSLDKLASNAMTLARTAHRSEDRALRRRFARAATDLGDDLDALARRARRPNVEIDVIARTLRHLDQDAQRLVDLADDADDRYERKDLRRQATQLEQMIGASQKLIAAYASKDTSDDRRPAKPAGPTPMTDAAYGQLVSAVRHSSFDKGKVGVIRDAAQHNWFTSNQLAGLMGLLSFDNGKIDAAVAGWAHLVDPQNSFVIYKKLSFDSSREKLRKRVSK